LVLKIEHSCNCTDARCIMKSS